MQQAQNHQTQGHQLVVYSPVCVGHLANYRQMRSAGRTLMRQLLASQETVLKVLNLYLEEHPLAKACLRLRREIRLAIRGAPLQFEHSAVNDVFLHAQDEQKSVAHQTLLKQAYRLLARMTHPDRPGGSAEIFHEVRTAYALKNLNRLIELYIQLVNEKNLGWMCGPDGQAYARQELQRPLVMHESFKASAEYAIVRAHMTGNYGRAKAAASDYLIALHQKLTVELEFLWRANHGQGQEEYEGHEGQGAECEEQEG